MFLFIIGNRIKTGTFKEIFDYLPSNGYKYDIGRSMGEKQYPKGYKGRQLLTHPVIFDYFLNHHCYEFIQKFMKPTFYYNQLAQYRNDLMEMLIDFYLNLDSKDKLKLDFERDFRISKEQIRNGVLVVNLKVLEEVLPALKNCKGIKRTMNCFDGNIKLLDAEGIPDNLF